MFCNICYIKSYKENFKFEKHIFTLPDFNILERRQTNMKTKLVGILVITLLIATVVPISSETISEVNNKEIQTKTMNGVWYNKYGGNGNDGFLVFNKLLMEVLLQPV